MLIYSHREGYALLLEKTCYAVLYWVLASWDTGDGMVAPEVDERWSSVNEALWYLASSLFTCLHALIENRKLYKRRHQDFEDLFYAIKCQLEWGRLPVVFCEAPLSFNKTLEARGPGGVTTQRPKIGKMGSLRSKRWNPICSRVFVRCSDRGWCFSLKMKHTSVLQVRSENSWDLS